VLREEAGRLVVSCDDGCAVRLDLGPVQAARARNRMPSGWLSAGDSRHYCPLCSPRKMMTLLAAQPSGLRSQSLI
jgi:hypothetical protein